MSQLIYQWIDFIWLPVGIFVVHKNHRVMTGLFIFACLLTMRTQVELMKSIGYETGIMKLMDSNLHGRGVVIYSVVILLYLVLAHYSPKTRGIIFFAATLSIYVLAVCLSMILMVF